MKMFQPELETMPKDKLRALQGERLKALVERAWGVPFYRRRMEERGLKPADIKCIEDLPKLPFTVKKDFRDEYPFGMLGVGKEKIVRIHASSGTTGKPKESV